ncbi:uncharacterized protein M421DRAFT_415655 [Didymella exigua CBS 183.55]|uniref:Uncharacterized protein n=1 Tax=Didymella exigua CBS 183.55 TaxID=1150837 RepID=A0A6A5RZM7_9PLEO|nr:uncharacterized protein M421DRAFT_415655 [Didymella exigua CBS 183.55]KAF1933312.1 hypothetical protein M421DRAFT_415655 [Didymella exigua CBS 183.55]
MKPSNNCVSILAPKQRRPLQSFAERLSKLRRRFKISMRRSRSVSVKQRRRKREPRVRLLKRLRKNKRNKSATQSNVYNYLKQASKKPHRSRLQSQQPKNSVCVVLFRL